MTGFTFDHEALFAQVTGREMRKDDADELRRLRRHMPDALADSPSYNFNLVVTYHQMQQLRATIAGASDAIVDDVEYQSKAAVTRLVDDAVKRIHASSPSTERAFYQAMCTLFLFLVVSITLSILMVFTMLAQGWISPNWLTAESAAKVQFADAVDEALGPTQADWTRRDGTSDQALIDIVAFAERRGTADDPNRRLSDFEACRGPGQVAYRSRGRSMCRFEVVKK